MGTNVSISMKDFWVNWFFFFMDMGSFRLKCGESHVWGRLEFLCYQILFLTTCCHPYWLNRRMHASIQSEAKDLLWRLNKSKRR